MTNPTESKTPTQFTTLRSLPMTGDEKQLLKGLGVCQKAMAAVIKVNRIQKVTMGWPGPPLPLIKMDFEKPRWPIGYDVRHEVSVSVPSPRSMKIAAGIEATNRRAFCRPHRRNGRGRQARLHAHQLRTELARRAKLHRMFDAWQLKRAGRIAAELGVCDKPYLCRSLKLRFGQIDPCRVND